MIRIPRSAPTRRWSAPCPAPCWVWDGAPVVAGGLVLTCVNDDGVFLEARDLGSGASRWRLGWRDLPLSPALRARVRRAVSGRPAWDGERIVVGVHLWDASIALLHLDLDGRVLRCVESAEPLPGGDLGPKLSVGAPRIGPDRVVLSWVYRHVRERQCWCFDADGERLWTQPFRALAADAAGLVATDDARLVGIDWGGALRWEVPMENTQGARTPWSVVGTRAGQLWCIDHTPIDRALARAEAEADARFLDGQLTEDALIAAWDAMPACADHLRVLALRTGATLASRPLPGVCLGALVDGRGATLLTTQVDGAGLLQRLDAAAEVVDARPCRGMAVERWPMWRAGPRRLLARDAASLLCVEDDALCCEDLEGVARWRVQLGAVPDGHRWLRRAAQLGACDVAVGAGGIAARAGGRLEWWR